MSEEIVVSKEPRIFAPMDWRCMECKTKFLFEEYKSGEGDRGGVYWEYHCSWCKFFGRQSKKVWLPIAVYELDVEDAE